MFYFYQLLVLKCNSIVAFTTYWKFRCCYIHCLFSVNDSFTLIHFHLFQIWYSKIYITFPLTQCTIHEYKAGNDVSEFTHSNCITLSYYSSHNTRVWFLNIWYTCLISVHSNLEHGLAILTESFSPLRSVLQPYSQSRRPLSSRPFHDFAWYNSWNSHKLWMEPAVGMTPGGHSNCWQNIYQQLCE